MVINKKGLNINLYHGNVSIVQILSEILAVVLVERCSNYENSVEFEISDCLVDVLTAFKLSGWDWINDKDSATWATLRKGSKTLILEANGGGCRITYTKGCAAS